MSDPSKRDKAPRDPVIIDLDETVLPEAPSPAEAPPIPEPGERSAGERALHRAVSRRGGGLVPWALGAFVALVAGVLIADFVAGLFARWALLGWVGIALLAIIGGGLVAALVREIASIGRLARIEKIQRQAATAADGGGPDTARQVVTALGTLYADRPELAPALETLGRRAAELTDAPDILKLAERSLLPDLDAAAEQAVRRASGSVAAVTAVIPLTLVDIGAILYTNVRMIRRIAEIYGGRAGWLGSWRLLRSVAQHLLASGAVAATDEMLGPLVGGGVLGTLSRRFGEATINAALTARVGVAAIEVCRPLSFTTAKRPKPRTILMGALEGWRTQADAPKA